MPLLKALVVKARRTDILAIQNNATLRAAARAVRGDGDKANMWLECCAACATCKFQAGILHQFYAVVRRLKWKWTAPFKRQNDWGWPIDLIASPLTEIAHYVRESTHRAWLRTASGTRPDLFGLRDHAPGIDRDATMALLRAEGKKKLEPLHRMFLINFLTGSVHTTKNGQGRLR